ncbi:hypothetical protein L292_0831 [Acinetobacter junii CIP 107470 = MTCC 11364]|uniref:Uncharacterized protein n=1 Tax=Acinetobacter junii CIP 107470 = MTCC 11364 TaxID=1217666 RepID=S7WGR7_ACIJU|nr:hypothetical protein L292_0831 [Acinetobacter junii CIP 107470 = MTCC 11364]
MNFLPRFTGIQRDCQSFKSRNPIKLAEAASCIAQLENKK